ncbi:FixH family protein [Sphingomonas pruni]|uniref:FixH family protein n=1 Tax=Sphingomonas pruni TaxID=40683 RepID=UPI0008317571|nr:FixH family protein [Sphingomonas pruni]
MTTRFTGWHMLAIMIGFFGVVIGVNAVMATDAIRTFGGLVVENSYVATTHYNRWLAEGRQQEREGWQATPTADGTGAVSLRLSRAGQAIDGASVSIVANHPVGLVAQRSLRLRPVGGGVYRSDGRLPRGRWLVRIEVSAGAQRAAFDDEIRV